jgi:uncharacterized membrane protein YkvA (DUF1232 family)
MNQIRRLVRQFRREIDMYGRVVVDPRTPRRTRWLLGAAVAYAVSPIDLIPDFIPVLGHLDDVIVLPVLVWFALRSMPPDLLAEYRAKVREEGPTSEST